MHSDAAYAGIELEEEQHGLTDGTYSSERYFSCPQGRALFVPLPLCRKDSRFQDIAIASQPESVSTDFGQVCNFHFNLKLSVFACI